MTARRAALTAEPIAWKGRPPRPGSPGYAIRGYFACHDGPADAAAITAWAHTASVAIDGPRERHKHLISMALSKERLAGRLDKTITGWYRLREQDET
jgi:hypothetical protein